MPHDTLEAPGNSDASQEAVLALASKDSAPVRYWAAYGIQWNHIDTPAGIETLGKLLDDKNASVRISAAAALCSFNKADAKTLDVLGAEVVSPNVGLRFEAGNVISDYASLMKPILPKIQCVVNIKAGGYGASLNTLMNTALKELGQPAVPWGKRDAAGAE